MYGSLFLESCTSLGHLCQRILFLSKGLGWLAFLTLRLLASMGYFWTCTLFKMLGVFTQNVHIHKYKETMKYIVPRTYILAFIHACMHTCIHAYIHTYVHTYTKKLLFHVKDFDDVFLFLCDAHNHFKWAKTNSTRFKVKLKKRFIDQSTKFFS